LLIGGGRFASTYKADEQHRPAAVGRSLRRYLEQTFAGVPIHLAMAWPGRIGISKDFAPIVGEAMPQVYFASGAAGLPWAAALGRYLADKITSGRSELDETLSGRRHFPVGRRGQAVIGTAPAFALSHGLTKYFQR
jgi:glycine/D-amino acid oxidase-like deaminating enzyme